MHPLHNQVSSALQTRHNIPVNAQWLDTFLTSRGPNPPPLPALISTAHFRILASDITTSVSPATTAEAFPEGISDVNVKERRLEGNVIAQVLDVLDVGSSKWSQVEAIERVERGEEVRGREVIRTVNGMGNDDEGDAAAPATGGSTTALSSTNLSSASKKLSAGPHKLLLQDARGTKVLAFELVKIPKIGLSTTASASLPPSARNLGGTAAAAIPEDPGMFIGCKLLLRPETVVRRGMIMLTPDTCVVLGGKVEAWDKKWKDERKQRLTALVREENAAGGG